MAQDTLSAMKTISDEAELYEPSEKYSSCEHVYLPLSHDLSERLKNLHDAGNIDPDQAAFEDMDATFCYFARLVDSQGKRLTALRRATQFKGVLKKRLLSFNSDALKMIEEKVFKLDNDFDLLVDDEKVRIYRPSGFEFSCKLKEAILDAVQTNVDALSQDLPFIQFSSIQNYASTRPRAARYLASIKSQYDISKIDQARLLDMCSATGVKVAEDNGRIKIEDDNVMGFLEVLDRRRYEVSLVPDQPEQYRAPSRQRI
jgi:hypothetical protein